MGISTPGVAGQEQQFATDVLKASGAPVTANNLAFLNAWFARENGQGQYNPLGTDGGQHSYSSFSAGVARTAAFLHMSNYSNILHGLMTDQPTSYYNSGSVAQDFKTWSGNSYAGIDVSKLLGGINLPGGLAVVPPNPTAPITDTVGAINQLAQNLNPGTILNNLVSGFGHGITDAQDFSVRLGLIMAGCVLFVLGVVVVTKQPIATTATKVAGAVSKSKK